VKTEVRIDGTKFLVNGEPTYKGMSHDDRAIEGLLMNSRMVQAIFDDECPETVVHWEYPDTGVWDADRNTDEFCAALPTYREHGLLGVTVGLQGGGSIYRKDVGPVYENSAFREDGGLKPAYCARLSRVLEAADECGMIVIVNYFYIRQIKALPTDEAVFAAAENASRWLLESGYRNVLVDAANEAGRKWWGDRDLFTKERIHEVIEAAKRPVVDGRRLLVGASTLGGMNVESPSWIEASDFLMPHGNGCTPEQIREKVRITRATDEYKKRPMPILFNEDSARLENMEAAVDEYCSWGYYAQGAGSREEPYDSTWGAEREKTYDALSGFQTVPVNWGINTERKVEFFRRVKDITSGTS